MPATTAVLLGPAPADGLLLDTVIGAADSALTDPGPLAPVADGLLLARELGRRAPRPGEGSTRATWELLATLGAADLTLARVVEPHLDALAILAQLPEAERPRLPEDATYGVYAAEGQGLQLHAEQVDGGWVLTGAKPWCSLAAHVSHALITAQVPEGGRQLFAVAMGHPGVRVEQGGWASRGLTAVPSTPVHLDHVPAEAVGGPGWYLRRPGFAWGGIGVAAVWHGGLVGVARRLLVQAAQREPDQVGQLHLGAVDGAVQAARRALAEVAEQVDAGGATGRAGSVLALRTRQAVADAAAEVLARAGRAMGPAPLTFEEEHARRVADLTVYARQHHAERDQAALGRELLATIEDGGQVW